MLIVVTLANELAFLLLLRLRLRLRLLLLLVVPEESVLSTDAVSEMRSPDMSMLSWLPVPPPVPVGTGPPGPPRRRRGCEVVLAAEELCFGREAVSGEDIFALRWKEGVSIGRW